MKNMPGCHKIKKYIHCRKVSPKSFDPRSFRTKTISKNKKIVIGCPKGKWNPKTRRCKVGTRIQKTMKKVK